MRCTRGATPQTLQVGGSADQALPRTLLNPEPFAHELAQMGATEGHPLAPTHCSHMANHKGCMLMEASECC